MIFTAGEGKVLPFMSLGYAGYMLHYANSSKAKGLVDNILLNPYARFDLGDIAGLQKLSFRLGWLQAMQRDRVNVGMFVFRLGGELEQEVGNWILSTVSMQMADSRPGSMTGLRYIMNRSLEIFFRFE